MSSEQLNYVMTTSFSNFELASDAENSLDNVEWLQENTHEETENQSSSFQCMH